MNSSKHLFEAYKAARMTPDLVGRDNKITEVMNVTNAANHSHLIHIVGEGGMGKSRLLAHLLQIFSAEPVFHVASELIDLYHTENNTLEGLMSEICRVLDPTDQSFQSYRKIRAQLDDTRFRRLDEALTIAQLRQTLFDKFVEDLTKLCENKRLVIAFDTAEKLDLLRNRLPPSLSLHPNRNDIVASICHIIKNVPDIVVILAGRPTLNDLKLVFNAKLPPGYYYPIGLAGFTETDALAYFEAIASGLKQSTDESEQRASRRVENLPLETRKTIFYCLCDAATPATVRPILLALAIDHASIAGKPLAEFREPLHTAIQMDQAQRQANCDRLSEAIVDELMAQMSPAHELIRILGWLRKGVSKDFLSEIIEQLKIKPDEFEKAWENVRGLSFIKERKSDGRLFLHDEMYLIVQKFALAQVSDAEQDRIFTHLRQKYQQQAKEITVQIEERYVQLAQASQEIDVDPTRVTSLRKSLRILLVELIHNQLRVNAQQGFQSYFYYSEEALDTHDEDLRALLSAEMQAFIDEFDLQNRSESYDGLRYADVVADEAVRWIKWLHESGKYQEALKDARTLQKKSTHEEFIQPGGIEAEAELNSWHGLLEAENGFFEEAIDGLQKAVEDLSKVDKSRRVTGILARAYNNLGYSYSIQGRNHRAIDALEQALPLWRGLDMKSEHANTLNNLAFALAEVGDFDRARTFAMDGLRLREKLGPQSPIGLSLNTLAEINIRSFNAEAAIKQAESAVGLFESLSHTRGRGLALRALAEAKRQGSFSPIAKRVKETERLLKQSEAHALETARIFSSEIHEPIRLLTAKIEVGCTYRDMLYAQLLNEADLVQTQSDQRKDELFEKSKQAFHDAELLAKDKNLPLYQISALINCAWLYHFRAKMDEYVKELSEQVDAIFRKQYGQRDVRYIERLAETNRNDYLVPLGDWEAFHGELEFQKFRANRSNMSILNKAADHLTLALICYHRYSAKPFYEAQRTRSRVYEGFKSLSTAEIIQLFTFVEAAETKYRLIGSNVMSSFLTEHFGSKQSQIILHI